jgi:signal transduction histidine kinase/CheY-like chemotaxis protein/HAMP domain-containing protein
MCLIKAHFDIPPDTLDPGLPATVMRSLRSISIRHKLLLVSLATTATALSLASAAFIVLGVSLARQSEIQRAEALLGNFGAQVVPALHAQNSDEVDRLLQQVCERPQVVAFCLYALDGSPLRMHPKDIISLPTMDDFNWRFRDGYLEMFRLVPLEGAAAGRVFLRYDPREYRAELRAYGTAAVGVVLVPFGLAWLLSSRLREVLCRPILQLTRTAERVWQEKDYSLRVPRETDDELGNLVGSFNVMLERIQERDLNLDQARAGLERRVADRTAELQEQVSRSNLLNQITRGMAQRQDLESILHVTLGELESRLAIDLGCVYLFDPASNRFEVAAVRCSLPGGSGMTLSAKDLDLATAGFECPEFDNDRPLYEPDLANAQGPPFRKLVDAGLRSAVAIPLRVEQRRFGLLLVARKQLAAFTPRDHEFLRVLGEQVALAGHQAQLHAELKKAYDDLRQTQEAVMRQDRLRALGQMASGIAHDINNALSPITGFAELLLETAPNLQENSRRYLEHIKTAGNDVAHIVARLREFYRNRSKDRPLQNINVNELLRQVSELTRPRWRDISQQNGLSINLDLQPDPRNPEIAGDEAELREALTNLIFNALDALPHGGTITLRSRVADLPLHPRHSQAAAPVILEVVDDGVGMDDETRRRCLEPFFSTKDQRGTGLGLAMVYGVVQRHEGNLEVESQPARGTTVRLTLPSRLPSDTDTVTAPTPPDPLPALRILFVDDEPLVRELVKEILQSEGHHVTLADGGQAGLDAFFAAAWRDQRFDAVITDLGMPSVDGRQLTHIVKRESPTTPVIMMTGWGSLMHPQADLRAPVDLLLNKPPSIRDLQNALRRVVPRPSTPSAKPDTL